MMKKIVGIILCCVVIGGVGAHLLMQKKGAAAAQYARYLPQDAVATVSLTHLNTITDGFAATALGRFLAKDTIHAIMQEMRIESKDIAEYDQVYDTVAQVLKNPAFRTVFGDDSTVAVLQPDRQLLERDPVAALRASLVVVSATPASGALDLFSRLVTSKTVTKEAIDGLQLTKIVIDPNQTIYGLAEGQTVLLAYTPAALKTCMAARQTDKSLDKAAAFQEAATFWQPYPFETTYSRVFLNTPILADLLKTSSNPELKQSGELLQGMEGAVSITYGTGQGLESRARTKYRYDQLNALVKSAIDSAAKSNPSLHLLQEGTLAYSWASSLRPELFKQTFSLNAQDYRQFDTAVHKALGVSFDELGRAIGPQYGGVLDDIVKTGLFPAPKMTLFLGIRDRKIAETAMNGLRKTIAEYGVASEEQEAVAGSTIYSWPLLPGEATQPSIVLTDSMFYLATSKQPLKAILTGTAPREVLAAPVISALGTELSSRLARANFGSFIIYPQRMSRQTGEMIDWVAGILVTTKNISISRLNREMVQLMQSTELLAATSDLTREQADWSMTLKLAPPQPAGKPAQ
ncbi:MAG: hypothetical protein JZU50_10985 [Desulfobulbaceae bacterium]|nr:hypothetical protein [Desulfobulbaceae bacterium]